MTAPASLPWSTCSALARSTWTRARALAHRTIASAADAVDLDPSHLSRWESERDPRPVPLMVLWSRALVPDAELEALFEQVRADRADTIVRAPLATPEGALGAAMQRATEMLSAGVGALLDGHVTAEERASLRPMLAVLSQRIRTTLDAWDAVDRRERAS